MVALLAAAAFALGGVVFRSPPPDRQTELNTTERRILAEIEAEATPREQMCDQIVDMVLEAVADEQFNEDVARQD